MHRTFCARWIDSGGGRDLLALIVGGLLDIDTLLTREQSYELAARYQARLEERD